MRSTITLLSLLPLATSILAAPFPLHPIARAVPDIKAVIRNPAPVDSRSGASVLVPGVISVDVGLKHLKDILGRAAPVITDKIKNPIDVVNRATPALDKTIVDPVDVVR